MCSDLDMPSKPTLAYDVETLRGPQDVDGGWGNPQAMGLKSAVVYDFNLDEYRFHTKVADLVADLKGGQVLSFNGIKFDNNVLGGNVGWGDTDLLQIVVGAKFGVRSVKEAEERVGAKSVHDGTCGLKGLSWSTLGMRKTGHGSESPGYDPERLWSYNLQDVRLTVALWRFWDRYGFLIDGGDNVIRKP